MILVISATGTSLDSPVDPRFGRAQKFIAYDTDTGSFTPHDNTLNLNAVQGAGIQSAMTVIDLGGEAVLTGNVGPKAFSALEVARIDIYIGANGTVKQAVEAYRDGLLVKAEGASVKGHW
jgi:predicted Fe-Mo cluster-binding NifX family protein